MKSNHKLLMLYVTRETGKACYITNELKNLQYVYDDGFTSSFLVTAISLLFLHVFLQPSRLHIIICHRICDKKCGRNTTLGLNGSCTYCANYYKKLLPLLQSCRLLEAIKKGWVKLKVILVLTVTTKLKNNKGKCFEQIFLVCMVIKLDISCVLVNWQKRTSPL